MLDFHAHHGLDDGRAYINIVSKSCFSLADSGIWCSIGILPWLEDIDDESVLGLLERNPRLGVGETGLDRRYGGRERQYAVFSKLCTYARDMDRVLSIHSVGRSEEILGLLGKYGIRKAVFHGFSSSYEVARKICLAGYHISLGPKCVHLRDYGRIIGLPLLVETDMETGPAQQKSLKWLYDRLCMDSGRDMEKEAAEAGRMLWKDSF